VAGGIRSARARPSPYDPITTSIRGPASALKSFTLIRWSFSKRAQVGSLPNCVPKGPFATSYFAYHGAVTVSEGFVRRSTRIWLLPHRIRRSEQQDVPPGLHFKLPLGIDVARIVPVNRS
jgi:hypothetical protein